MDTSGSESSRRVCRICTNAGGNRLHAVREMMFGTRRPFEYLECSRCGCLQICDIPHDLGEFYSGEYYSFAPTKSSLLRRYLKRARNLQTLGHTSLLGQALVALFGAAQLVESLKPVSLATDASILDVGCGHGSLLRDLHDSGFRDLLGVDPFIDGEIIHGPGCKVLKQELADTVGEFDLIMLHHSFEHMAAPRAILGEIVRLLKPDGMALIRIPLSDSYAWRTYGVDWVQLDAPRHLHLHSKESLLLLAADAGLLLERIVYDSTALQFWGSEQYRAGVALQDRSSYAVSPARSMFSSSQIASFKREARGLNALRDGDQACFYFRRRG